MQAEPLAEDDERREQAVLRIVHLHVAHGAAEAEHLVVVAHAGLLEGIPIKGLIVGKDDGVRVDVVAPRHTDHHDLAAAGLEQGHLVLDAERVEAGQLFAELHDELDNADGGLADLSDAPVACDSLLGHRVLYPLQLLRGGKLVEVLEENHLKYTRYGIFLKC